MVDVDMVELKFKSTKSTDGEMGVGDGADKVDDEEETSTVAVS